MLSSIMQKVDPRIDVSPPPPSDNRRPPPPRETVHYSFEKIPVGKAGRFDKSASMVKRKLSQFRKTYPGGANMQFKVRAITPRLTRVWRIK